MKWTLTKLSSGALVDGRYELGVSLPSSMGSHVSIWSAHSRAMGRTVAIFCPSMPQDVGLRERLTQEMLADARRAARIDHPGILRVLASGVENRPSGPLPYIVTDMPPDLTLRDQLRRYGRMQRTRAMRLFLELLQGLALAHKEGLVHRGIKPSSIRLLKPGEANESLQLTGFGLGGVEERLIAQLVDGGRLKRLPAHLPPEYKLDGEVGPSMDVYQMGLILIEMLNGERPLSGEDEIDRLRSAMVGDNMTLSQALHLGELGELLERALAPDPRNRLTDAGQFLLELERIEGVSTTAEPADDGALRGSLPLGTVLADVYEIRSEIGRGGFAIVYEGVQHGIDRPVAIKVMTDNPKRANRAEFEARFMREARSAAQIDHPNVVVVHHYGLIKRTRQPFMVMERLVGDDLEHVLAEQGGMMPTRAFGLIRGCLDALSEVHRKGIIHKDLKPSNLFLVEDRRGREIIKITDFGIAGVEDTVGRLTLTGRPVCTPTYAAPEYVLELIVKPQLDIYQIGLVLVEMLTGAPVVDEDTVMKCLRRHLSGQLDLPPALMAGPLGPVLTKALARDYRERFASADEFLDALEKIDPTSVKVY